MQGRTRIALIGDAMIAAHCLRRLVDSDFEIVGCLPASESFARECRLLGLPTFEVDADLEVLREQPCDWLLSIFNIRILPPSLLEHPDRGVVNFHDGPLPRYAGLYAPVRALLDGETMHGVAWHLVDEGIDTGDLLVTEPVPIEPEDRALSLQLRCLDAGCRSFERLMPMLHSSRPEGRPQRSVERTCFGHSNWSKRGIEIDWTTSVAEIERVVAAHDFGPYENPVGRPRFRYRGRWHVLHAVDHGAGPDGVDVDSAVGIAWMGGDRLLQVRGGDGWLVIRESDPPIAAEPGPAGSVEVRAADDLAAIEAWDAGRFRHELDWRRRLGRIGSNFDWSGDGDTASRSLGPGSEDLACGLLACHAIHGDEAIEFALDWSLEELREGVGPDVDPAVTELLHPQAPIRIPIGAELDLRRLIDRVDQEIARARRRGPFLRDILARTAAGGPSLVDPARMPIRVVDGEWTRGTTGPPWVFARDEHGTWTAAGPAWAMGTFADLFEHRRRSLEADVRDAVVSMPRAVGDTLGLLESWEGSQSIPTPRSFLSVLASRLEVADDARACIDCPWDGGASDREMHEFVHAWARRLRDAGVGPGALVPVALDRGATFVAVMVAVLRLGATFVPLDPLAPEARIRRILEILAARVGVAADDRDVPGDLVDWITSAPDPGTGVDPFAGVASPSPDDVAFVLFTSGTTGVPRGVRITHRNMDQYLETVAEAIDPRAYDGSAWTSSVAFDSSLAEVLYPLVHEGRIVALDRADLASATSLTLAFTTRGVTGFGCATPLWASWVKHCSSTGEPIPVSLRHVDIGGSVADPDVVRRWLALADPSINLVNRYGPTEATVTVTAHVIGSESLVGGSVPIGRPERGTEIRILDEAGRRVPPGVAGEIWIGGGQVALGYLGESDDQGGFQSLADASGRWFRTGDRGSWNPRGEILFGGRFDDQVKVGGFRIEMGEIREAVSSLGIGREFDVIVIGEGVERLLGVVVEWDAGDPGFDSWAGTMQERLESVLPRYAIPRRWLGVDAIPRTPSGKTDRRSAERLFAERQDEGDELGDPRSPDWVEKQVERVLGRRVEDRSMSFFELGGDSLGAMRLHAILEESCGRSLPSTMIHAARGIDDLVDRVARANVEAEEPTTGPGHRRHRVAEVSNAPTVLFLPGIHGEATLRHVWAALGSMCSVAAIDLDLERCRTILRPDRGPGRFKDLAEELAQLVVDGDDRSRPVLVGYSIGGWLAFEIVSSCLANGVELPPPVLIEPEADRVGSFGQRCRSRVEVAIDATLNLDRDRLRRKFVRRAPQVAHAIDPRDPRGRPPDDRDREFQGLLIDSLSDHRPIPANLAVRLIQRRGRDWRFAAWHRLARGGVTVDRVDLHEHEDFFRYGSEGMLVEAVGRHLEASSSQVAR